ncbi:hypothetical protein [Streptomyces sp. NPDC001828]|uniref:hypothetical protein n=1 Tax=Streptomyces sp. NPDC001828 TaxID=3364615 RepID=UPI003684080C
MSSSIWGKRLADPAAQARPADDRSEPGKSAAEMETLATAMRRDPSCGAPQRGIKP